MIKIGDKVRVKGQGVGYVGYIVEKAPYPYHVVKNKSLIGVSPSELEYADYKLYRLDDLELIEKSPASDDAKASPHKEIEDMTVGEFIELFNEIAEVIGDVCLNLHGVILDILGSLNDALDDDSYMNIYDNFDELKSHFEQRNITILLHDEKQQLLLVKDDENNDNLIISYHDKNGKILTMLETSI